MNKLEKLEEQYRKLGEEIQALKKEKEFIPGWYMYWDDPDGYRVFKFIKNETSLEEKKGAWIYCEPVTQELLNQFLPKPKTKYDWSKFPDWATIAVMNSDGSICCGDHERAERSGCDGWIGRGNFTHGWNSSDEYVSYMDKSQWEDSFERRPK